MNPRPSAFLDAPGAGSAGKAGEIQAWRLEQVHDCERPCNPDFRVAILLEHSGTA